MPLHSGRAQTKQKQQAQRARDWGDPDKGYGVGGGRGPGPGYQEKDYSLRRTLNDLGITRPPGADIPQMESLVQSELNDLYGRGQVQLPPTPFRDEPDKGLHRGYILRPSGKTRPGYDPTAFRGYGNRADSSYTREPTGEGWGYGMANITRPEMEGYSPIDPTGWFAEQLYKGVRPQGETWEAPVFSAVLGLLPFDTPGYADEARRFSKALKALKDEGKWIPDQTNQWDQILQLKGRDALEKIFRQLHEGGKRLGYDKGAARDMATYQRWMKELGDMASAIVRHDKTGGVTPWDYLHRDKW